jgi:hypothetical protein
VITVNVYSFSGSFSKLLRAVVPAIFLQGNVEGVSAMSIGRTLILVGAVLVVIGLLFTYGGRLPLRLGRLPGDIEIRGRNSVFYFPLMTCILLSAIVSVVMWLFGRR